MQGVYHDYLDISKMIEEQDVSDDDLSCWLEGTPIWRWSEMPSCLHKPQDNYHDDDFETCDSDSNFQVEIKSTESANSSGIKLISDTSSRSSVKCDEESEIKTELESENNESQPQSVVTDTTNSEQISANVVLTQCDRTTQVIPKVQEHALDEVEKPLPQTG